MDGASHDRLGGAAGARDDHTADPAVHATKEQRSLDGLLADHRGEREGGGSAGGGGGWEGGEGAGRG